MSTIKIRFGRPDENKEFDEITNKFREIAIHEKQIKIMESEGGLVFEEADGIDPSVFDFSEEMINNE